MLAAQEAGQANRRGLSRLLPSAVLWLLPALSLLPMLWSSAAAAQTSVRDVFQQSRQAYNRGSYDEVVGLLEPLIGGDLPVTEMRGDPVLLRESRKYLGAAYVLTSRREAAVRQFDAMLRAEGDDVARYRLNAAAFPAEVHAVFDEVQTRLVAEQRTRRDRLAAQQAQRERERREALLELYAMAQEDEIEAQNDPFIPFIPFGAGQFQNGDPALGWFFALSEALTASVATVSLFSYLSLLDEREQILLGSTSGDLAGLSNALTGLIVVNWVSVGATVGLMIAGLIEALVSHRPTTTHRRRREVPQETLDHLQLVVRPGGVALHF